MRDYGKVFSTFWTSPTTRSLSDDGRTLALYLLTSPHTNIIGCFRLPDGYVSEDLGWTPKRVSEGFGELFRSGFGTRDSATKWVMINQFLKWNPLENPNQGKFAMKVFEQVPDDFEAKSMLANALATFGSKVDQTVLEPFRNGFERVSKPHQNLPGNQQQQQEHQQQPQPEQQRIRMRADPDEFMSEWNAAVPFSKIREMSGKRLQAFNARMRESQWAGEYRQALAKIASSSFLRGENTGWKISADFFLKPDSVARILEGKYDDIPPAGAKRSGGFESLEDKAARYARSMLTNPEGVDPCQMTETPAIGQ